MLRHVLVIDDDAVDRRAIQRHLLKGGEPIAITEAPSGADAIALLASGMAFDCVFLDYNLSDMTAPEVLDRLRDAQTGLTPAPVVVLTGQVREAAMIDVLGRGAQDYLIKNIVSPDMLAIAIVKAISAYALKITQFHTEARLRQAEKMEAIGRLTSGVAHDFNNLLGIIIGNAQLLRGNLSPLESERALSAIETAGESGAALVRRLMVFTRQRTAENRTVEIGDSLRDIKGLLTGTLGAEIAIEIQITKNLWPVRLDSGQLENALINLAVNARDAMPCGGNLTITAENMSLDDGDYVRLSIADTGHGMPLDVQARIFEPFFTTKDVGSGTGLGLAMVYGFVEQSGGRIAVHSSEEGTIFTIDLPRWKGEGITPNIPLEDSIAALPLGQKTILLVEDNSALGEVTETLLSRLGYNVVRAADGHDALRLLQMHRTGIDLLFTDIVMPGGIDGIETARQAKALHPGLRLLYTSGNADLSVSSPLVADAPFIAKPYRKEHLAEKIASVLVQAI